MATKTKTDPAALCPAKVAEPGDPNMEKCTVSLPLDMNNKANTDVTVGLNGRIYKIQRGVPVEVPLAVAEILRNSEAQNLAAMKFIQAQSNDNG